MKASLGNDNMRVGILRPPYEETIGGGFTYIETIINALTEYPSSISFETISFAEIKKTAQKNSEFEECRRQQAARLEQARNDRREKTVIHKLWDRVIGRAPSAPRDDRLEQDVDLPRTTDAVLNQVLVAQEIDLLWLIAPFEVVMPVVPYVVTVWDLAHRIFPFFPEVSSEGWKWDDREEYYRKLLPRASWVITGTERGAQEICTAYGVNMDRLKVLPLPTPRLSEASEVFSLPTRRDYILYPANFWAHKNHVRLLQALKIVREERGEELDLILVGSDQGTQGKIANMCSGSLHDHVHILGFVSQEYLTQLYESAKALVYLSFFGPDNLPPLEAFSCDCPVVASDHLGHREQLGNAAIFVDPMRPSAIADGIIKVVRDQTFRSKLIKEGRAIADTRTVERYIQGLDEIWQAFEIFQECWENPA